ncbi:MAG: hypothetical protein Tsb0020_01550 [Haliangiales bacterium]
MADQKDRGRVHELGLGLFLLEIKREVAIESRIRWSRRIGTDHFDACIGERSPARWSGAYHTVDHECLVDSRTQNKSDVAAAGDPASCP